MEIQPHFRLAILALSLGSMPAWAEPGDGIRLGDSELSPALQTSMGYDSNVVNGSQETGAFFFELRPSLRLDYKSTDLVVRAGYEQAAKMFASDGTLVQEWSYFDDISVLGEAIVFPDRKLGLVLKEQVNRRNYLKPSAGNSSTTSVTTDTDDLLNTALVDRTENVSLVEGRYSPGSALDIFLGTTFRYDIQQYDTDQEAAQKVQPGTYIKGKWRFFPKTAATIEISGTYGNWKDLPACFNLTDDATTCPTSQQLMRSSTVSTLSAVTGVGGQVTNNVEAGVFVGYGRLNNDALLSSDITGASGFLGQGQLVYSPLETQTLSASYFRRFSDTINYDYAISNLWSLTYAGQYFGRFQLSASASYDHRLQDMATDPSLDPQQELRMEVISTSAAADLRITRWLTGSLSVRRAIALGILDRTVATIGFRGVY